MPRDLVWILRPNRTGRIFGTARCIHSVCIRTEGSVEVDVGCSGCQTRKVTPPPAMGVAPNGAAPPILAWESTQTPAPCSTPTPMASAWSPATGTSFGPFPVCARASLMIFAVAGAFSTARSSASMLRGSRSSGTCCTDTPNHSSTPLTCYGTTRLAICDICR